MSVVMDDGLFVLSAEVANARANGLPIVALESTIISHGMKYPANLKMAIAVESIVREGGAVPATIAILNGRVHVGLTLEELEKVATIGMRMLKVSRRDLAHVCAAKLDGATTVAATMICAHRVGIRVFCTGGIGGVHRGAQDTMDISADLTELSRTPVTVVCAGVKSILDIPRTLEYLETAGVPVITLGADRFPAFFTADSGCSSPTRLDTPRLIADHIRASLMLGLQNGTVVAVPIPLSSAALGAVIEKATQQALSEAAGKGIIGRHVTPFLLQRIAELTKGESLQANLVLIKNNAVQSTAIACALHEGARLQQVSVPGRAPAPCVLVVGGCSLDVMATASVTIVPNTSNPGRVTHSFGGVGRNIAECCARLGQRTQLISAVGSDMIGEQLLEQAQTLGIDTSLCARIANTDTASYIAIHEPGGGGGDLTTAIADFTVIEKHLSSSPELLAAATRRIAMDDVRFVVIDGNLSVAALTALITVALHKETPVWFEPISIAKSSRLVEALLSNTNLGCHPALLYASPNTLELIAIAASLQGLRVDAALDDFNKMSDESDRLALTKAAVSVLWSRGIGNVIVLRGEQGALVCEASPQAMVVVPATPVPSAAIKNTNGAGDCLVGAIVSAIVTYHATLTDAVVNAVRVSALTIQSKRSVSKRITPAHLPPRLGRVQSRL